MTKITTFKEVSIPLTSKERLYAVDSLALKIPLDLLTITHDTLNTMCHNYSTENEVLDETESYKKNALEVSLGTYNAYFKINKHYLGRTIKKTHIYTPTLSIAINSKFVEQRYFEGITIGNIYIIYTKLMSLNVFKCDFEVFMKGYATDVDVKQDTYILNSIYTKSIGEMDKATPERKGLLGSRIFKEKDNQGLQWNDRNCSSKTFPFMKTYNKERELLYRSIDFFEEFLSDREVKDLCRFEYNVKTRPIKKKFDIKFETLEDLLNTSQNEFNRIHKAFVIQNFKDSIMSFKMTDDKGKELSPTTKMNIRFIEYMLSNGETIELIIRHVLQDIPCRKTRSKKKGELMNLYLNHLINKKEYGNSESLSKAFAFFGGGTSDFLTQSFEDNVNESDNLNT